MARQLLVLEEVIGMLQSISAPTRVIDAFRKQAEFVLEKRPRSELDNVTVASGFGQATQQGFVELTLNDQLSQFEPKKAREIGLMLIEAAEAASSDEMIMKLLDRVGIENVEARGNMLIELREIRQGTRGTARPQ